MGDDCWMGKKRETFAEILAAAPEPLGQKIEYLQPIRSGEYTDEAGVLWRMRGGERSWARIARLIRDPRVRVVHVYLNEVREVAPEDRESLLSTIRPYVDGPAPDDHTDFTAAEFKDGNHNSMVLVEETC
jgi:hypothetical protein